MKSAHYVVIWLIALSSTSFSTFSPDFKKFLRENYGDETAEAIERNDLGSGIMGSFGGKSDSGEQLNKRPLVFVHGALSSAVAFGPHLEFFKQNGYTMAELYGTSYGEGLKVPLYDITVQCDYIKNVRTLIEAVNNYTNSKVDIIGWSMGTEVSRKAILGGKCFDTNETLGDPLTDKVETYISIGGVTYGLQNCPRDRNGCNDVNSFYCGCKLLEELNSQGSRYEGQHTYALYSRQDEIIGHDCCGNICGSLANAELSIEKPFYSHYAIFAFTLPVQLSLLNHVTFDEFTDTDLFFLADAEITVS